MTGLGRQVRKAERLPVRRPDHESFAARLNEAIRERGLTIASLQRSLRFRGVTLSLSALSYWRSGQRQPEGEASLEAVARIEEILELPPGHLLDRIGPARRPGPRTERVPTRTLLAATEELAEALEEQRLDDDALRELSGHATVHVDRDRRIRKTVVRSLVRANTDGADRIPLFLQLERASEHPVAFTVLGGGTLVESHEVSPDFYSAALVLDRPLLVGETALVEYEMSLPHASGFHFFEQHLQHRTKEVVLWVRFHPDAVPRECETYVCVEGTETTAQIDLTGVTSAHYAGRGVGPGTVGVRWQW